MVQYYAVFGIIVALAVLNYGCLLWITVLQKRLRRQAHHAPASNQPAIPKLTAEQMVSLQGKAVHHMEQIIDSSAGALQAELEKTSSLINQRVAELSDKVVQDELTKYQNALEVVRQASIDTLSEVQQAIDKKRDELQESLEAEVVEEKQRVLERFDERIGEVVSSFLVETLGTNVDLGAQSTYLFATLEASKADIKKALSDGP